MASLVAHTATACLLGSVSSQRIQRSRTCPAAANADPRLTGGSTRPCSGHRQRASTYRVAHAPDAASSATLRQLDQWPSRTFLADVPPPGQCLTSCASLSRYRCSCLGYQTQASCKQEDAGEVALLSADPRASEEYRSTLPARWPITLTSGSSLHSSSTSIVTRSRTRFPVQHYTRTLLAISTSSCPWYPDPSRVVNYLTG